MYVQFSSCVHYENDQNIPKHTREIGCLFCFFIYVNKIGFAVSFAIKKVNISKVLSKRNKVFLMNFHQMRQPLRNTLAKTLEHVYFGTSHYQ